ncbi:hypothetical protein RND59_12265 [Vibrio ruber]|uniref:Uncharacterized protein n=1 Tax=Vibrio ruber (strain DSM 16370 / JCM 11486 / BCRC 17186 / CECT 7878 / LMG 23124 / VR1) TaxID=1123498 RepID=A0A1R4LD24_VIBR1|nr:hypothetical protein [Vibrio ruber]WNJ94903.1 hypothetical protein RND59_12265 [Vibrio ruber]SJN54481.1 hypothetical protein VR7878_00795 [Vibrio ruber DSM 16370]
MSEANNYQMAIDLLRCHLGLSEEEAKQQLGIDQPVYEHKQQHQSHTKSAQYSYPTTH